MRPYEIRDITGVAQGSTVRVRLPLGVMIGSVIFDYKRGAAGNRATAAQVAADWDEVRVMVNGDAIQRLRGNEIVEFAQVYYGDAFQLGSPKITFEAPWASRPEFGRALALGTAMGVDTALIEIDLAGDAGAQVALKAWAMVDSGRNADGSLAGPGVLRRLRRFTPPNAIVGLNEWNQLPLRGRLLNLHLHGAAEFEKITLRATGGDAAGVIVWEGTEDLIKAVARGDDGLQIAANAAFRQRVQFLPGSKVLSPGNFSIDLAPDGDLFGGGLRLDDLAELRIEAEATTGGAYTVLAETLE